MTPAIVVLAYQRPDALLRLLTSLSNAFYPPDVEVPLIISLDHSERDQGRATADVAQQFGWPHGSKTVLAHEEHLGVVGHFYFAGGLVAGHGAVVLLEDDLTVAPPFYEFAVQILDAHAEDERIAGCCLYGLWFNGFTLAPFRPIDDGGDVFFLGVPHTQGLCFSANQWSAFEAWSRGRAVRAHPALHPGFLRFGQDEWFPSLASYMAENGRFFCFPRTSLTVGWGDAGAHFDRGTAWFQTPIQLGHRAYALPPLDKATAVYDGFFELLPDRLKRLAPTLRTVDFDLDINATKQPQNLRTEHVLTSRPVRKAIKRFGLEMDPPELNLIHGVAGEDLALAHRDDVRWDAWSEADALRRLHEHAWRHHRPSRRRGLRFVGARVVALVRHLTGRQ